MPETRLIRRVRFRAAHRYRVRGWTDEENRRAFGPQAEAHEHDWLLEVHVVGPPAGPAGFVVDLGELDRALDDLTGSWDGADLNAVVPAVQAGAMQPGTEALARWAYDELKDRVSHPARLDRVAVFESPDLGAQYPA